MAERIIDGIVYDESFARTVGSVYTVEPIPGNCSGGRTRNNTVKLMKRLEYRNPNAGILEHFEKGSWSFTMKEDVTVETNDYFLVSSHGSGYSDPTDIVRVSRENAFKWACDNMEVGAVLKEFPDLVRGGRSFSAEVAKAEAAFKNQNADKADRIATLEKELAELKGEGENNGLDSQS